MSSLVLIPGMICNARLWHAQIPCLQQVAVVAVADVMAGSTIPDMASALLAALGSQVALEIMGLALARVQRLALLSATHGSVTSAITTAWPENKSVGTQSARFAESVLLMLSNYQRRVSMPVLRRAVLLALLMATTAGFSQTAQTPNQTLGFGAGQLLTLTYTQNFDCIDQPVNDLNYNGIKAAADPGELQTPICVVGKQPTINPPGQVGNPQQTTAPLYVLVPMFSVDHDQNPNDAISCDGVVQGTLCGSQLGQTLIQLFGAVPEGFKQHPLVYAQCPDPGLKPGTCTMHASRLDLGPVLAALGFIPPPSQNVFLPTPNHSHVVDDDDINDPAIWWQVIPVLVLDQSIWPPQDGSSGLTSSAAIDQAERNGLAVEAPSNFFLFFSTVPKMNGMHHMQ